MKQIYIAIGVLLVSLTLFVYTTNATSAVSNGGSPCDRNCNDVTSCDFGDPGLICGWTDCTTHHPTEPCVVSGTFCCIND